MLNNVSKSYHTRITVCQFIFRIELNHEKTAQLLLENVYKIQLLLLSQFCYSEDFFCSLKKQNAMPGWCSIIFVLVLFLSYLKERNKKISKEPLKKILQRKKSQTFQFVLTDFLSYFYLSSHLHKIKTQ